MTTLGVSSYSVTFTELVDYAKAIVMAHAQMIFFIGIAVPTSPSSVLENDSLFDRFSIASWYKHNTMACHSA